MNKENTRYVWRHGKRIEVETMNLDHLAPPRKRKRKPFKAHWVQMPRWWLEVLQDASASGSAYQLALVVLAEEFKRRYVGGEVVLSSEVTRMPHSTRIRAAKELVELGLISVEWDGKRAGTVSGVCFNKKTRIPKKGLTRNGQGLTQNG
jgi:hypothetical protein